MLKTYIIAATSTDGFIAKDPTAPSTKWTSEYDKKRFVEMTKHSGVVVMGAKTFATISKALPGRRTIVYSNTPIDVPGIETTSLPPAELISKLESEGLKELAICGGAMIYTMFMEANVVDNVYLTVEPVTFGTGIPLFNKSFDDKLELINTEQKPSGTIFKDYKVIK
ncbi:MAG TPA: dihydrofolate reductase family protein [Candidatus Paceibacterota bacterium]